MPRAKKETDRETLQNTPVLSVAQVAAYLNVGKASIWKLLDSGKLKGAKIGADWRVLRTEVDRFLLGEGPAGQDEGGE